MQFQEIKSQAVRVRLHGRVIARPQDYSVRNPALEGRPDPSRPYNINPVFCFPNLQTQLMTSDSLLKYTSIRCRTTNTTCRTRILRPSPRLHQSTTVNPRASRHLHQPITVNLSHLRRTRFQRTSVMRAVEPPRSEEHTRKIHSGSPNLQFMSRCMSRWKSVPATFKIRSLSSIR